MIRDKRVESGKAESCWNGWILLWRIHPFFYRSRGKQNDLRRRFQKYHSCHCNFTFNTPLSLSARKLSPLRVKTFSSYPLAWKILILSSAIFILPLIEKDKYEALLIVGRSEALLNNNQCRLLFAAAFMPGISLTFYSLALFKAEHCSHTSMRNNRYDRLSPRNDFLLTRTNEPSSPQNGQRVLFFCQ